MSESEMIAEPDWLAAEPSARAKLTVIMAAVRRCYAECTEPQLTPPTGPHLSTTMAEVFIGQLLMTATGDAGDLTPAGMYLEGVRAERQRIIELAESVHAGYRHYETEEIDGGTLTTGSYEQFANLLREEP